MSKFVDKEMTCNICGHIWQVTILTATTTEGSADLDFRPPEKRRSAMPLWVHKCELCGAVLSVYETTPNVGQEFIASNKYQTCAGIGGLSENGKKFVKIALIYEQAGQMKKAGNYFLNAAWCCDDEGMDVNAKLCREEALRCWNEMGRRTEQSGNAGDAGQNIGYASKVRQFQRGQGVCQMYGYKQ